MTTIINRFGTLKGWNSLTVTVLGRDLEGITALKYMDKENKQNVYGAGKYPIGRSTGNYEPEASITLIKEEVDALKAVLPPGKRLQDIPAFPILAQYEGPGGTIFRDRIENCEFTNDGVEIAQGDGNVATEYTLIVSHISYNVI